MRPARAYALDSPEVKAVLELLRELARDGAIDIAGERDVEVNEFCHWSDSLLAGFFLWAALLQDRH